MSQKNAGYRRQLGRSLVLEELRSVQDKELSADHASMSASERAALQSRKWHLVQRFIKENPFRVSDQVPRAEQWLRVLRYVRDTFAEESLERWVREQMGIAENLAAGIRDLRPRKNGPCHSILLVHARDRARKAEAIHQWTLGAEKQNENSGARALDALPGERVALCFSTKEKHDGTAE